MQIHRARGDSAPHSISATNKPLHPPPLPAPLYRQTVIRIGLVSVLGLGWLVPGVLGAMAGEAVSEGTQPAQAPAAQPASRLEEITVLASPTQTTFDFALEAGTHYSVRREEIENANYRSLDEVLEFVPGINVRVGGDGRPRVDMRGLRSRQIKVLVNGIPFNAVGDGSFDPSMIPAEYIQTVDVLPGAGSQLYGDGALAGAINVVTRRGEIGREITTRAEVGSGGASRLAGTYAEGFARGDVFVSVSRRDRDNFPLSNDFLPTSLENGSARQNSDLNRNSLFGVSHYALTDSLEVGFTLNYQKGESGVPTSIYDDRNDIFAPRPRYERREEDDGWFAQLSSHYNAGGAIDNLTSIYIANDTEVTSRYADASFTPTQDPTIRNTFTDNTKGRIIGGRNIFTLDAGRFGRLSFMFAGRQERLQSECVIKDLPVADTNAVPNPADADRYTLTFTELTTADFGDLAAQPGIQSPVAELTAANRPDGGIDFSITNIAGSTFGDQTYLKYVYLAPGAGFELATLSWSQAAGSQGEIGNVNIRSELVDGYDYSVRVNFRRPEQADPANGGSLFDGETAGWIFDQGNVNDFFGAPVSQSGAPEVYAAVGFRRVEARGFWGAADEQGNGGVDADAYNVSVAALSAVPGAGLGGGLVANPEIGKPLVDIRVCASGGGGGGGGGNNRVESVSGLTFVERTLTQDRQILVGSTALEYSVEPFTGLGLVGSFGLHGSGNEVLDGAWIGRAEPGYSVGGFYSLTDWLRLRSTFARKVRIPTVAQLYDPDRGNPELDFEIAESVEAGFDWQGHALQFGATLFRQWVENFIQTDPLTERYSNIARLRFTGLETYASLNLGERTTLRGGYTWLESEDQSPGTQRDEQQYTPRHRVVVSADQALSSQLKLHVGAEYTADQVYYSRTFIVEKARLPNYFVLDANLAWSPPDEDFTLYVGADNLFDANYVESYALPQAGRFIYAGVRASFD